MNLQITEKGANPKIARYAATQGMVLLENRNDVLPLSSKKIALFGGGAHVTVKGGTGSGNVTSPYEISIRKGFENAGYVLTSSAWLDAYAASYQKAQDEDTTLSEIDKMWSGKRILVPDPALTEQDISAASDADTAIYVVSRVAGEGHDRQAVPGDYYLTDHELHNLKIIAAYFKNSIVVLNTCVIDTKFFQQFGELDAMLLMSLAGMESGNALVDVLSGSVTPSGKLTDTWAIQYEDYPAYKTFGRNAGDNKQQNYEEGIYVGYRYFDSFNITPAYEFGYGLSYTEFSILVNNVFITDEQISIETTITNTGNKYTGKEVVQIYISAPDGELEKPYQSLIGFGKTNELKPGGSQTLTISFPVAEMASYSEALAAWVLEAGDYLIRVGHSSRNTKVAAIIRLDETKITEQVSNRLPLDQDFKDKSSKEVLPFSYATETDEIKNAPVLRFEAESLTMRNCASTVDTSSVTTYLTEGSDYQSRFKSGSRFANDNYVERFQIVRPKPNAKLYDVYSGEITMEQFVAQFDLPALATLVNGRFSNSDYTMVSDEPILSAAITPGGATGQTTTNFVQSHGIPNNIMPDGPTGLHIPINQYGCTAFPVGVMQAQSWDAELWSELGKAYGKELLENQTTMILGPGMNIHRDPLGGRNFEYYSEDPQLTGIAGAMFTLGVQSHPGVGVTIKHFAANEQETERAFGNSSASERTLREIYLKGFEITVKSAQPMTVMTAYNKINGAHTSSSIDLITHILRGEWGFKGFVMTDWFTQSDNGLDMHAGNDMIMGGWHISKLINSVMAPEPVFNDDGSVDVTTISLYSGRKTETIEKWNAFVPGADGEDFCSTLVAVEVELGSKVKDMEKQNIAKVTRNQDGTKTVTYRGTSKDAYTALGDLQKSAMNILNLFLKCWTVRNVYNAETGYTEIPMLPYSSLFSDLKTYLKVSKNHDRRPTA
ncbi:glycoside hydrolase family 3 protein [Cohnella cholangitidis]|uniref:Glycoside hydrolase n=1 Tax=Cohnella cholangitidis TaxID=2598458 RepID=A0A7G5C440_9BACL|nr:glycoside hydrolase family 3 protein [Cohnella cholangitidis]QMV43974.1 glycoside hydrolase [Cohnella cholangitidis]